MPELPHVEAFKQYVDATAVGRRVSHTHVRDERVLEDVTPASLAQRLSGRCLAASRRHGKYLGISLEEADAGAPHLVLHFAMSGNLERFESAGDEPEYAVLTLDLDDGGHLAFTCKRMFCSVHLADSFEAFVDAQGLGPDALSDALDEDWFLEAMEGRQGTIKNALMDQSMLAGIGNEFADEILFHHRTHPAQPVEKLGEDARKSLWRDLRRVLQAAADGDVRLDSPPDSWLLTAREENGECPRCGGTLLKSEVAGRSSYYCPQCQPPPEDDDHGK